MDDRGSRRTTSIYGVKEENRTGWIVETITQDNLPGKKEKITSICTLKGLIRHLGALIQHDQL